MTTKKKVAKKGPSAGTIKYVIADANSSIMVTGYKKKANGTFESIELGCKLETHGNLTASYVNGVLFACYEINGDELIYRFPRPSDNSMLKGVEQYYRPLKTPSGWLEYRRRVNRDPRPNLQAGFSMIGASKRDFIERLKKSPSQGPTVDRLVFEYDDASPQVAVPKQLPTIGSDGGPYLVLPVSALDAWGGYDNYEEYEKIEFTGHLEVFVEVADTRALVLGTPDPLFWIAGEQGGYLVTACHFDANDDALMQRIVEKLSDDVWEELDASVEVKENWVVFDASFAGQVARDEGLVLELSPGNYQFSRYTYKDDGARFYIVKLTKCSAKQNSKTKVATKKEVTKKQVKLKGTPLDRVSQARVDWLRRWAEDVENTAKKKGATEEEMRWVLGTTLLAVTAFLAPGGETKTQFDKLESQYRQGEISSSIKLFAQLAATDDAQLSNDLGALDGVERPQLEKQDWKRFSFDLEQLPTLWESNRERAVLAASLNGCAWILANRSCSYGLGELFRLPFRIAYSDFFDDMVPMWENPRLTDKKGKPLKTAVQIAAKRALEGARKEYPGIDLELNGLNYSSVTGFCASFLYQLANLNLNSLATLAALGDLMPNWSEMEEIICQEVKASINKVKKVCGNKELSMFVLWADPYNGDYEVVVDGHKNNEEAARKYNARRRNWMSQQRSDADSWRKAVSISKYCEELDYNPDISEFEYMMGEGEFHDFRIDVEAFTSSDTYQQLNEGAQEDGFLEGHMRFVITAALQRLAEEGAFNSLNRAPVFRVAYAYCDNDISNIVAVLNR